VNVQSTEKPQAHGRPSVRVVNADVTRSDGHEERLAEIVAVALANGMDRAKVISTEAIVVEKRAQAKCLIPRCTSYGKSLTCPPNTPSTDEVKEIVRDYRTAVIMQVDGSEELDGTTELLRRDYNWCYESVYKLHEALHNTECRAFNLGYYLALGMGGGDCRWCEIESGGIEQYGDNALLHANAGGCAGVRSGHCTKEYRARPALEAMSVNVLQTAANAGLPFYFSGLDERYVTWNAILLVD
jgi:predicted metal-binding protein